MASAAPPALTTRPSGFRRRRVKPAQTEALEAQRELLAQAGSELTLLYRFGSLPTVLLPSLLAVPARAVAQAVRSMGAVEAAAAAATQLPATSTPFLGLQELPAAWAATAVPAVQQAAPSARAAASALLVPEVVVEVAAAAEVVAVAPASPARAAARAAQAALALTGSSSSTSRQH